MPGKIQQRGLRIAIDRGGTFTDCVCKVPNQADIVIKTLSLDPRNYSDAPTEAIRRVLEIYYKKSLPRGEAIDLRDVESIRMGTTVATNALLERKGEPTAFLVTEGFKDLLEIGNQSRPHMFDLSIRRPAVLYKTVEEISERVLLESCTEGGARSKDILRGEGNIRTVIGTTGEKVQVIKPLDTVRSRRQLQKLYDDGFRALAICLMHSYTFDEHERQLEAMAKELGFTQISLSSRVSRKTKIVTRGNSTVVDCYLTPVITDYINRFLRNFPSLGSTRLDFMQSDGGLVSFERASGLRSILSGPAGGVVGIAKTCFDPECPAPVIGFDIGGTSTDVSRFAGELEHVFETVTAGISLQTPQLDVNTIAAGGGSMLFWREGMMSVGPESASSDPGPACYRKGGPLTITDANLVLGRLVPEFFPSVFGLNENEPLDPSASLKKFEELTAIINKETAKNMTVQQVAEGFVEIANNAMCGPIRALTENRGFATDIHHLAAFGGGGGQHACAIARILGISTVLMHKHSSVLSAEGIGLADIVYEAQKPCAIIYDKTILASIDSHFTDLKEESRAAFADTGVFGEPIFQCFLNMRYEGSDTAIMTLVPPDNDTLQSFVNNHQREFGFTPTDRSVFIDSIRIRAISREVDDQPSGFISRSRTISKLAVLPRPEFNKQVIFNDRWVDTPVYTLNSLHPGSRIAGPALVIDNTQTLVVEPQCEAVILEEMVVIDVKMSEKVGISSTTLDPIQLSVFRHRFFGIAEQMGRALQKTSVSANIKERLDFSCAIFDPEGHLVANAPHVPAMIGSMGFAVKSQIKKWGNSLQDGDVLLSNSPEYGGVHLPDLTVITPVFDKSGGEIIFWTASRGHHADVGGILPGSMPPTSKFLWEEGAVLDSFLLVRNGVFNEEDLVKIMVEVPSKNSGCSGTRCLQDNLTDIKAQAAANYTGIQLIRKLIAEYSMPVVQFYMIAIQDAAEKAVRGLFKQLAARNGGKPLQAVDYMDDGTPIFLKITIREDGSATFDFTGSGPQVYGNWNAPPAITTSAIIFALRCMVDSDIPLNHGCIRAVDVILPRASFLNPTHEVAVCAGNVLTSQRLVDTIFQALGTCAASQGCMNNFTFGIDDPEDAYKSFGYYETICGGSGAGPTWQGTSGVHTNMTNTRITDPEILERRYPVILRDFSIRSGSGGLGLNKGGNGITRDVEFRVPMTASILSERRAFAPPGMNGGENGQRGKNLWVQKEGQTISIGGKNSVRVARGDRMVICTPGGGGWGVASNSNRAVVEPPANNSLFLHEAIAGGSVETRNLLSLQV